MIELSFIEEQDAEAFLSRELPPQPACFPDDTVTWIEWCYQLYRFDRTLEPSDHFCHDCLPAYQKQMRQEGRCAHPEAIEVWKWTSYGGDDSAKRHALDGEYEVYMVRNSSRFYSHKRHAEVPTIREKIKMWETICGI